ncbi:hypothetical protein L596_030054 [Steinernema carpocapsae]|uniref:Uncharacterized protein n=1 Tax=Steinernema carpocapsae TaxID=34508 RepID=A0A4V5ZXF9_STECR|nr:hypothetical protein L596_030054 [Steinernema carpocapsae]
MRLATACATGRRTRSGFLRRDQAVRKRPRRPIRAAENKTYGRRPPAASTRHHGCLRKVGGLHIRPPRVSLVDPYGTCSVASINRTSRDLLVCLHSTGAIRMRCAGRLNTSEWRFGVCDF